MALDKIIVENFKAFKGQHIFDLKQLNVFTGANNSGKSTLIKAISLFSKGLEKGDFPSIDLFETDSGSFKDLVNRDSGSDNFKIGFFIEVGSKKLPIKVLYEFIEDKNTTVIFNSIQVYYSDQLFVSINRTEKLPFDFKNTEYFDLYEYEINEKESKLKDVFCSPAIDDYSPEFTIRIHINTLQKIYKVFTDKNITDFLERLKLVESSNGYWWLECFNEINHYSFHDSLSYFKLNHLYKEILNSSMISLNDFNERGLFFQRTIEKGAIHNYQLDFKGILSDIFGELLRKINDKVEDFRKGSFYHIKYPDYIKKHIPFNDDSSYLFRIKKSIDEDPLNNFYNYIRESLKIFKIDGLIDIENFDNTFIQLKLIYDVNKTDLENTKKKNLEVEHGSGKLEFKFFNKSNDYTKNRKENIAELGKGLINLIGLILKIGSISYDLEILRWKKDLSVFEEMQSEDENKPIVIIEEPEVYLHPNYQAKLADYFCFLTKSFSYKFIIETHNVYFIKRIQLLVTSKELNLDNLNIYFLNIDDNEKKEYKMVLREDGVFINKFGDGFYNQTARQTIELINLQNKN